MRIQKIKIFLNPVNIKIKRKFYNSQDIERERERERERDVQVGIPAFHAL